MKTTAQLEPLCGSSKLNDEHDPPTLIAAKELPGWSLLGWAGPMTYDGQDTIIENDWGSTSLSEVDMWIERFTAGS